MFEIQEREVAEQVVLTEQRHVLAPELPAWIGAAMGRLQVSAMACGGVRGSAFVIYHGEVSDDSDGPVEVCLPIDPAYPGLAGTVAVRREPAHHEAYTRLIKAQVEYPQILSAYDAVGQWTAEQGRSIASSPREVYFADFGAAAPGDEVCDVVFPIR